MVKTNKIRGLHINKPERRGIEAGTLQVIKRPIEPQPDSEWMRFLQQLHNEMKMFRLDGHQLFWIEHPCRPGVEIRPRYKPGVTIWCQYSSRQRDRPAYKTTVDTTKIFLTVDQVSVDKIRGLWHWVYWVRKTDKPEQLNT